MPIVIDRDGSAPIVNLDGIAESLPMCRIDRDGSAPIVNRDGVVESFFLCLFGRDGK